MNEEVSAYEQAIEFVVGFAGSGKSTTLADRFKESDTMVLTPTHKAKEVLLAKGVKNVGTIHALLKLVPTLNQNMRRGQRMQKLKRIGDIDLSDITTIGVDEFSLINVEIMNTLLEMLPIHCKVLVFGDPYQLEPVDGESIDPSMFTDNITELTTQYRAEAPEVVETFMRFMEFIKSGGDHRIDLRLNPKIEKGTVKGFNPLTDRALAYTNQAVSDINDDIAKALNLPEEISLGESVFINSLSGTLVSRPKEDVLTIYPKCVSKGKLMRGEKLIDTIDSVEYDIETFNTDLSDYEFAYIKIEGSVYKFHKNLHHYADSKELKSLVETVQFALIDEHSLADNVDLKKWCADNRGKRFVKSRGKAWSKYLAHSGLVWDLRRPFASTIHKSQGMEFNTVYIAQDDIKKVIRGKYYMKYSRLMYVALSRAIKKVVVI